MRIAGVVEAVIDFAEDAIVRVTGDLGVVREPACDTADDLAIAVAKVGLGQWHFLTSTLFYQCHMGGRVEISRNISKAWHESHNFVRLPRFLGRFLPFSKARQVEQKCESMTDNHRIEETRIQALIEEQRHLAASKINFNRVIGSLLVAGLLKQRLALLSNEAIGQLMFDAVWNVIDVLSPELAICQAATERLLNSSSAVKTTKEKLSR